MTDYAGIDYGRGMTNIDNKTGIRFGIISAHDLTEWLWESVETVYLPYCPHCNEQLDEDWDNECNADNARECIESMTYEERFDRTCHIYETADEFDQACVDLPLCPHCGSPIEDGEQWPDCAEADGQVIDEGGYKGFVDSSNDVWLTESPYFTHAQFCSPCAPGAGHLGSPCESGPTTYCFGHDWFDGGVAPYPVFSVSAGELVQPS